MTFRTHTRKGTGGGGGTGLVTWGPNFGSVGGDSLPQVQSISMPAVGLTMDLPQIQAISLTDLGLSTGVAQVHSLALELGLVSGVAQSQSLGGVEVGVLSGVNQPHALDMGWGVLSGVTQSHALGGSVLSAPFWQSVSTKALSTLLGATEIVVDKPAGLQVGDLMVAWIVASGVAGGPAGWAGLTTQASGSLRGRLLHKIADAADVAAANFTFTLVSSLIATGEIHRISGIDATTPIHKEVGGGASVTDPVVPSVTTTVVNCLVMAFVGHVHLLGQAHAPPASNTERTEFSDTNVTQISSSSYTRIFAATGSTGTATVNCDEIVASDAVYQRIAIAPGPYIL